MKSYSITAGLLFSNREKNISVKREAKDILNTALIEQSDDLDQAVDSDSIAWTLVNESSEPLILKVDDKKDVPCHRGETVKFEGKKIGISLERYVDQGDGDWCNHTIDDEDIRDYAKSCHYAEHCYPIFKDKDRCKTRGKNGGEEWDYYLTFHLDCDNQIIYARESDGKRPGLCIERVLKTPALKTKDDLVLVSSKRCGF